MFCFPCMLFADRSAHGYEKTFVEVSAGCDDFKKGVQKIAKHENSSIHGEAVAKMLEKSYNLEKCTTVVQRLQEAERKQIEKTREILKRLVDVTLFLSKQNLAFRGHLEKGRRLKMILMKGIILSSLNY